MNNLPDLSTLQATQEDLRKQFLNSDLELCSTFLDLADTRLNMGDLEMAQQAFTKAEEGYATVKRMLQKRAHSGDITYVEIEQRLNQLGAKLQRFRCRSEGEGAEKSRRFEPSV
jgi:hypothetical protein